VLGMALNPNSGLEAVNMPASMLLECGLLLVDCCE
jgi:hypothetical protein